MTANKCDICGTLYERVCTPDVRINIYIHPYGDEWMDLCPKCQEKLEKKEHKPITSYRKGITWE